MCLSSVFLILYVSAVDAIFELFVYCNTHGSCEKDKMQKARQKCTMSVHRLKEYTVEHDRTIRRYKMVVFVKI